MLANFMPKIFRVEFGNSTGGGVEAGRAGMVAKEKIQLNPGYKTTFLY